MTIGQIGAIGHIGLAQARAAGPARYLSAEGAGSGDGLSIASAAALSQVTLDTLGAEMAAVGGTLYLVGPATTQAPDAARAVDEFAPIAGGYLLNYAVKIRSVANPSNPGGRATFAGDRFAWTLPATETETDVTSLSVGALAFVVRHDDVDIAGLHFRRTGSCIVFDTNGVGHRPKVSDCTAYNVQRFIDAQAGVTVNSGFVSSITLTGFSKAVVRLQGNSTGWTYSHITGVSGWQSNDAFARLLSFHETAHDCSVSYCHASKIYDDAGSYWNGDGFEVNDGNHGITFTGCSTVGATDGGFDTKGLGITITGGIVEDVKRSNRCWGEITIVGGTSTAPRNRGGALSAELGNGSSHMFASGYFTPDVGTDPFSGSGPSRYRGKVLVEGRAFVTAGQDANTTTVYTGGAGAQVRFVNCTIDGVDLSAATAGTVSIATGSKVMYFTGDVAAIGLEITTSMTQSAPEGAAVSIPLAATSAAGGAYTECTWELDRSNADVISGAVTLSSWAHGAPTLNFTAPAYPGTKSIPLVCEDAAGNRVSATMTFTATQVVLTDPPLYAGAGALVATSTAGATTVTPALPSGLATGDVVLLVAYATKTTTAPTVSGYTLIGSRTQSGTIAAHLFYKRAGASETAPSVVFDTAIVTAGSDLLAAKCYAVRGARATGTPYEGYSSATNTTSDKTKAGQSVTTTAGNRLAVDIWVLNNDCTDVVISGGTWALGASEYTTVGSDATFVLAHATQAAAATVATATATWTVTANTTGALFGLAFLPEQDP